MLASTRRVIVLPLVDRCPQSYVFVPIFHEELELTVIVRLPPAEGKDNDSDETVHEFPFPCEISTRILFEPELMVK